MSEAARREESPGSGAESGGIAREVRGIIAERCGMKIDEITAGVSLEGGLGVDSLALIEINVALEERFGIVGPDYAAPGHPEINTVGDVIAFVEAQVAGRAERRGAP